MSVEKSPKKIGEISNQPLQFYLDGINEYLRQKGYEPYFETPEQFRIKTHTTNSNVETKLKKAYNYFVKGIKSGRGAQPSILTYGKKSIQEPSRTPTPITSRNVKENKINLISQKEIFNSPKMSSMEEENLINLTEGQQKLASLFGGSGGKGKAKRFWGNKEWEGPHQTAFTDTFTKLSGPYEISYNPNYLRKDYFDYLKENNAKYENWNRDASTDYDGDGLNDIVISDDNNNWRYFNGYSLNPKGKDKNDNPITTRALRQQYLLTNPEDEGFKSGYITYLHTLPGHKAKPHKIYETNINAFLKRIGDYYKDIAQNFNTHDKLIYQKSNYKGKLKSLLNRYVVYPTILFGLGIDNNTVKSIIFAAPKSPQETLLKKIYQDKKDTIKKALATNQNIMIVIGAAIENALNKILVDAKKDSSLTFLLKLIKNDTDNIEKYFYSTVTQTIQKLNGQK